MRALRNRGFTLIETLAAISLLSVAIIAPMSLATKSLAASYYVRDEVTAYYLAQEAIEVIRSIRDGNILQIVSNDNSASYHIFTNIPIGSPFYVDVINSTATPCSSGPCPVLRTDGTLYGYQGSWTPTNFTRTINVTKVGGSDDELRVVVTVSWQTGGFQVRTFSITENLYRWAQDNP